MARRYTIQCSMLITQTRCTLSWTAGGRQAGRRPCKKRGRKEGGWEGGIKGGWGKEGCNKRREGGRQEGGEGPISPSDGSL